MREQFISSKAVRLVKEKGFDPTLFNESLDSEYKITQSLLQKLLRDVYGLSVEVNFNLYACDSINGWYWRIIFTKRYTKSFSIINVVKDTACYIGSKANMKDILTPFSTYEEALDIGLIEALKLL